MLVYAIDFGTSNSLLAAGDSHQIYAPIALDEEAPEPSILRSVLYLPHMNQCFYGSRAIKEFVHHDLEGRFIRSIKKFLPIRSFIGTFVDDRPLNLEDIIALFLKEMRTRANKHFNQDVKAVVLGRPARFSTDDAEDQFAQYRLEKAARLAGFEHIEFLPEPVAAAREFRTQTKGSRIALIADFGGGTSDYTVIRLGDAPFQPSDVLAIGGVSLAGDSLDGSVMRHRISSHFGTGVEYKVPFGSNVLTMPRNLMEKICSPADISLLRKRDTMEFFRNVRQWSIGDEDREKMDRLFTLIQDQLGFSIFEEIEGTKRRLSDKASTQFSFTYPDVEIEEKITRKEFDQYVSERVDPIISSLDETVKKAGLKFEDIDLICCTGGTAKVPVIREKLIERFGESKLREHNIFHSVVQGLAERAHELAKNS
jgi:hypothetical chaperone protein